MRNCFTNHVVLKSCQSKAFNFDSFTHIAITVKANYFSYLDEAEDRHGRTGPYKVDNGVALWGALNWGYGHSFLKAFLIRNHQNVNRE